VIVPDQAARTRAWQCFDRSLDVAAGAGTGKTRVLVDRYLAWVLGEAWKVLPEPTPSGVVASILAITFTEKAAGEMQERIARSLRVILSEPVAGLSDQESGYVTGLAHEMAQWFGIGDDVLQQRARAMLAQSHRMEVSTIHAFAARVLRTWPLEAGVHPEFTVDVEGELRRKALHRAFVDATHAGLLGPDGARWAALLAAMGEDVLVGLLLALLDSEFDGRLNPAPNFKALAGVCVSLEAVLARVEARVRGNSLAKHQRVRRGLSVAGEALGRPGLAADPDAHLSADERTILSGLVADLKKFPSPSVARLLGDQAAFGAAVETVRTSVAELLAAAPGLFGEALALYGPALAEVRRKVLAEGLLSFDDLLRLTDRLLASRVEVAAALASRYGQLLVDEFQDTNAGQCRILSAIANAEDTRARLFVVGDPKQSIYAFRQADLAAYESFVGGLDERCVLTASFRSQGTLVDVLNRGFDRLFVAEPGLQPAPQPLEATRAPVTDEPAVRVLDAGAQAGGKRKADEAREVEAHTIKRAILARDALGGVESGRRWSRFAVLSRVQSEAATIVQVLEEAGIPCVVTGDKEFYRRQEVLDATNLLRVMLDPADGEAWVGLLRCPIGGVPDAVLVDLATAGFFAGVDPIAALGQAEQDAVAAHARHIRRVAVLARTIDELRTQLFDGPIDLWLETLMTRLPIPELHATEYLGERKSANLLRLLRGFCDAAVEGSVPLFEWLSVAASKLVGSRDESESALADETTDAVRIMSIHASKGLQFDHVFVPRLDWRKSGGDRDRISATLTAAGWVLHAGGKTTWGAQALAAAEARVDGAECLRLLYVACTRARETLTLLGRRTSAPMARMVADGFSALSETHAHVETDWAETLYAQSLHALPQRAVPQAQVGLLSSARAHWRRAESRWERANDRAAAPPSAPAGEAEPDGVGAAPAVDPAQLGSEVHALLELWALSGWAVPETVAATPEARELVAHFLASPLANRVRTAAAVHPELPFVSDGRAGVIDLLLQTGEEWVVVDYKTNQVNSFGHARHVAQRYAGQADAYVRAVKAALGTDRVRFEAWFLRGPWAVPL